MDLQLRQHLVNLLESNRFAHMNFNEAVEKFPIEMINSKAPNVDYTFWHLIEHIRITQWDILDFCINPNYKYMNWPEDYWPAKDKKATQKEWNTTIKKFDHDLEDILKLVKNTKIDLFSKIPWGEGQTILREVLLVADHNAYHIGELGILRQIMKTWPSGHK